MTYREILDQLDRNDPNLSTDPDWDGLSSQLQIDYLGWSDDPRLKAYWVAVWLCTDTHVGTAAYYLDDQLVALSHQAARKSSTVFKFVSREAAETLRQYLLTLLEQPTYSPAIADLDEEVGSGYQICYSSQVMGDFHKKARNRYTGEEVTLLKAYDDMKHFHDVVALTSEGEQTMNVNDLEFYYATSFPGASLTYIRR